ncbi:unnamed protein product [Medioppia subpectinata]|uniref:SCP domain-containing protein n=1 Tax=Medioppia subpectinata TaxID=1979941 RepID=A0A7R9KFB7_9ACAR|nr:unnamed protein product [Medioppia subpectinata]CAG2101537.1 unnamed protein product [Medioppia subpectinata]
MENYFSIYGSSYCAVEDHSDKLEHLIIEAHNAIRKDHNSPKLTKLTDNAYTRNRCKQKVGKPLSFTPEPTKPEYGENVYRMNGNNMKYEKVATLVSLAWAKNTKDYVFTNGNPDAKWLSFTQLVWKKTTQIACAICGDTVEKKVQVNVVCNYLPAGNVKGEYTDNVKAALGRSSARDLIDTTGLDLLEEEGEGLGFQPKQHTEEDYSWTIHESPLYVSLYFAFEDHSDELEGIILDAHNKLRKPHKSEDLKKLTDKNAKTYVRERCKKKVGQPLSFTPPGTDDKYGENVYRMNGKNLKYETVAKVVSAAWLVYMRSKVMSRAKSAKDYPWKSPDNPGTQFLSFTQLLWKKTTHMTCAVCGQKDPKTKDKVEVNVVCIYSPAGNVKGEYKSNVVQGIAGMARGIQEVWTAQELYVLDKGEGAFTPKEDHKPKTKPKKQPKPVMLKTQLIEHNNITEPIEQNNNTELIEHNNNTELIEHNNITEPIEQNNTELVV